MLKELKKKLIIAAALVAGWFLLILIGKGMDFVNTKRLAQSDAEQKAAIALAESAVYEAFENALGHAEEGDEIYAPLKGAVPVDGIFRQDLYQGEAGRDAFIYLRFEDKNGKSVFCTSYFINANDLHDSDSNDPKYYHFSDTVNYQCPDTDAYDILDGNSREEYRCIAPKAFLKDCTPQPDGSYGRYIICVEPRHKV